MRWKHIIWILITVIDEMHCSSELEGAISFEGMTGCESRVILFPFVFKGNNIVISPTTKYNDLKRNTRDTVMGFVSEISFMMWYFLFGRVKGSDRLERLFDVGMKAYLEDISIGTSKVWMNGNKTFSELLELVYERLFQCNEREGGHVTRYGRNIIEEVDDMIKNIAADIGKEEEEMWIKALNDHREHGVSLCNREVWKQVVSVEKIVCNICKRICIDLKEEELLGLMAEGNVRKILKAKFGEEKVSDMSYLEFAVVDISLLLDAHKEYGEEVMKELVKQMLLGKNGKEINRRYVDKVAGVVREIQRRREREIEKNLRELLKDEEKAKIKKKGKKKKKRSAGVPENKEEEKKESETEEVEAGEETEMLSEEVGGARRKTGKKSEGGRKRYKIHRRVLRWRKSPEKIKKEWDRGSEERWRGRSLEEIKEQKVFHDIVGVLELLRSEDAENSSWMQESTPRAGVRGRGWWRLGFLRAEERGC
ncbi:DUF1609 domain-containing protein [Encephalitozoon cuniculi]|nr:DUF1609 domain-containing protein [Encephalitozoon cuniculi]